jgi:hypothetical protein
MRPCPYRSCCNSPVRRDARLGDHPVTVWVDESRAVRYTCANDAMSRVMDRCFGADHGTRVGELGMGTNCGVVDGVPLNAHINERRPGIHLGFGQHNQPPNRVDYECALHLDLISRGGLVWVDDDPNPLDLEHLVPSTGQHPNNVGDEDVFSPDVLDCCGLIRY